MKKICTPLLLLALVVMAWPSYAQKLYKIVDENGNVSFSQFPPAEKKENTVVDDITVQGGSQSTVTETVDGKYCGKIQLPRKYSGQSAAVYAKQLDQQRKYWRERLDRLNQRIDSSNQNAINRGSYQSRYGSTSGNKYYQREIESNTEQVRDLRCALSWVDGEMKDTNATDVLVNNKQERERLQAAKAELQAKLDSKCGALPAYDPNDRRNASKRKYWYDCSDKMRRELDRIERSLRATGG